MPLAEFRSLKRSYDKHLRVALSYMERYRALKPDAVDWWRRPIYRGIYLALNMGGNSEEVDKVVTAAEGRKGKKLNRKIILQDMKKSLLRAVLLLPMLLGMTNSASAQDANSLTKKDYVHPRHARMDRSKLNIGTYFLKPYAVNDENVREAGLCGIDFFVCQQYDRKAFDLFYKYKIGVEVAWVLPSWWGGGAVPGSMAKAQPLSMYEDSARKFRDHPAIWGMDMGDEPAAPDFEHCGKIMRRMQEMFPNQFIYLNIMPAYASAADNTDEIAKSQLGATSYQSYLDTYCRYVPSDYICYDVYTYASLPFYLYQNLDMVSKACRKTDRSHWIVLQVNSSRPELWLSTNQLRYQAYTAMAYGVETIIWACYTAGWWHNQVLDTLGHKTQQYYKLRQVNSEIHYMARRYMNYRNVGTDLVGRFPIGQVDTVANHYKAQMSSARFHELRATDDSPLAVGRMKPRRGGRAEALFISSNSDMYDEHPEEHTIRFKADAKKVRLTRACTQTVLRPDADGVFTLKIRANEGLLLETI